MKHAEEPDPELGTVPEGTSALKVFRKGANGKAAMLTVPGEDGGAYVALSEVPIHSARDFFAWLRERWGAGVFRVQWWRVKGNRHAMCGTSQWFTVQPKAKKKAVELAPVVSPFEAERRQLADEKKELDAKREKLLESQLTNQSDYHKSMIELVLARTGAASAAPSGVSAEAFLKVSVENAELRTIVAVLRDQVLQLQRVKRPKVLVAPEPEEDEDEGPVGDIERVGAVIEKLDKLGVLDMAKALLAKKDAPS